MSDGDTLRILVVDDEKIALETTLLRLQEAGHVAQGADNPFTALERLEAEPSDVVLTDLRMPNMDGLELLGEVKSRWPETDVILMTAYGTLELAVSAMHEGAADFLSKPFDFRELQARLEKLAEVRKTRRELAALKASLEESGPIPGLVGSSRVMREVRQRILLFAQSATPVVVSGETGTGKELVARSLHRLGDRSQGPFVSVACGAIPGELAESEMLGHERGAFTGAVQRRRGSFERADGGTLLLDDVDDLPQGLQMKLLRALQEGAIVRVGGEEEIPVDVRVVATTKVDLLAAVRKGKFREDLYYRLRGLEIRLPPLRERGDDVLLLAQHFLEVLAARAGAAPKALSPDAAVLLRRHGWPGNVRELRRVLESAVVVCPGQEIEPLHLPESFLEEARGKKLYLLDLAGQEAISLNRLLAEVEAEAIQWALRRAGGEQQRAAELLGLPRTTLQNRMNRHRKTSTA